MSRSSPSIDKIGGSPIHFFIGQLLSSHCVPGMCWVQDSWRKGSCPNTGEVFFNRTEGIIDQCFSDLNVHTNAEFDSVALRWGLGVYISNELLGDSHTVQP